MRHGKKINHLGRTKSHRDALMSNMACSLIKSKRINTTLAKAKSLRKYVEPLITKSKNDDTHSRRVVFSYLQDKEALKELFDVISEKIAERNGGYTRIIKLGTRLGDNAETALIELVDFNENLLSVNEEEGAAKKSRRGRSRSKSKSDAETTEVAVAEEAPEVAEELSSEETVNNDEESGVQGDSTDETEEVK